LAVKQLNSIEFEKLIKDSSGTLLDVRTLGEFKNGHIKDAGQLNYYALDFSQRLLMLSKDQPIYLYCNTGYRSQRAAEILVENGYKNVYNLEHGILEWNLKNFPVLVEPDAKPDTENKMEIDEFTALVNSDKLVFIDFYAPWCAPCRKMMPMIDSLKTEYKSTITIVKINVDASKNLTKKLKIPSVPLLVLYKNGSPLFSHYGLIEKNELTKLLNSHSIK
jgi:thioredoxin